jgi:thiamine-monophosphate kinase
VSSAAAELAQSRTGGQSALDHAYGDGEDFELLLAATPETAEQMVQDQPIGVAITRIGSFVEEPGLWQVTDGGELKPLAPTGYEH